MGGAGNDGLRGSTGANQILGNGGNDSLNGLGGADTLDGGGGNDLVLGNTGTETLTGGLGFDALSYFYDSTGVSVSLLTGSASGGNAAGDVISAFEVLNTGSGNDYLQGSTGNNVLRSYGGDDTLDGDLGNDTLVGGFGADTLLGGEGNDRLNGQVAADMLDGGAGNDTLTGGTAGDTFVFTGTFGQDEITDFGFADVARVLATGTGYNNFADYDANGDGLINATDAGLTANVTDLGGGTLRLCFDATDTAQVTFTGVGGLNTEELLFV